MMNQRDLDRAGAYVLRLSALELHEAILQGNELLLDMEGRLRVRSSSEVDRLPRPWLLAWCNHTGVYCVPTTELIDWLKETVGDRSALDVAAGHGALGRALQIHTTDARTFDRPEVAAEYRRMGHPPPFCPPEVETLDALAAVAKYKPQVVLCAWGSELDQGKGGFVYGIDERALFHRVETYVHIGARRRHLHRGMRRPDEVLRPPWLRSRSALGDDQICVWNRR